MRKPDPTERPGIEVSVLSYLNDTDHPVELRLLRVELGHEDSHGPVTGATFRLRDDGLVTVRELKRGGHLVCITAEGKQLLQAIYSQQRNC